MAEREFKLSAVFPHQEMPCDPAAINDFAQAVEALGYDNLIVYDHVIGANPASWPGQYFPYTHENPFYEPMVLFAYLANCTSRIGLSSGVFILPQRQTVLFAKQAATVDILCSQRLRLGVGIGWNPVEYEALDKPFNRRGAILNDQIPFLRRLWSEPLVTEETPFHKITDAGLLPLPARQIPIWIGGNSEAAKKRAAQLGDGWFPVFSHNLPGAEGVMRDHMREYLDSFREMVTQNGRDPDAVGIEAISLMRPGQPGDSPRDVDEVIGDLIALREAGASGGAIDPQFSGRDWREHVKLYEYIAHTMRP